MRQFLKNIELILSKGERSDSKEYKGLKEVKLYNVKAEYDLRGGFPIETTTRASFRLAVAEFLWFLQGGQNIHFLKKLNCNIWDEEAWYTYLDVCNSHGFAPKNFRDFILSIKGFTDTTFNGYSLGDVRDAPGLGWRGDFNTVKNIVNAMLVEGGSKCATLYPKGLKEGRSLKSHGACFSTRWVNNSYRISCLEGRMSRQYIHSLRKASIVEAEEKLNRLGVPKYTLNCDYYQPRAEMLKDAPHRLMTFALLTERLSGACGYIPGVLYQHLGEAFIYEAHKDSAYKVLEREPFAAPRLRVSQDLNLASIRAKDILPGSMHDYSLDGYEAHKHIRPSAVKHL